MYRERSIIPDQGTGSYRVLKGEALVVDLGERGVLFFLMGEWEPFTAFTSINPKDNKWGASVDSKINKYRWISLVSFKDLADPKSRFSVDWTNLEKDFGDGVFVKSIAFVRTKEPATLGGIDQWLPWLDEKKVELGSDYGLFKKNANK